MLRILKCVQWKCETAGGPKAKMFHSRNILTREEHIPVHIPDKSGIESLTQVKSSCLKCAHGQRINT